MKQKKHGNMLVIAEIFAFGSIIQDLKYNDADKWKEKISWELYIVCCVLPKSRSEFNVP